MAFHQYMSLNGVKTILEVGDERFGDSAPVSISQSEILKVLGDFKNLGYSLRNVALYDADGGFANNGVAVKLVRDFNKNSNYSVSETLEEYNYLIGGFTFSGEEQSLTVSNSGKLQSHGENNIMVSELLESLTNY